MDEMNGAVNGLKSHELVYQDFAEINEDDFTVKNGIVISILHEKALEELLFEK